jgi:hypothetical protein
MAARRLSAGPAESEAPGTEINGLFLQAVLKKEGAQKFIPFGTPSFSCPEKGIAKEFKEGQNDLSNAHGPLFLAK